MLNRSIVSRYLAPLPLHVSPVLDCFSGEIVALEIRDNMKKELCVDTVKQLKHRY